MVQGLDVVSSARVFGSRRDERVRRVSIVQQVEQRLDDEGAVSEGWMYAQELTGEMR